MPNTFPANLPYPNSFDPVANGAQNIEDLAQAVNDGGGLWLISHTSFVNQPSVQINNCFITGFTRFRIIFSLNSLAASSRYSHFRLSASGTPATINYLSKSVWWSMSTVGSNPVDSDFRTDRFCLGPNGGSNSQPQMAVVDIYNPNVEANTSMTMNGSGSYFGSYMSFYIGGGLNINNTVYDGLYYFPTADNVSGSISVYGYQN
jgi:hypothetical protein